MLVQGANLNSDDILPAITQKGMVVIENVKKEEDLFEHSNRSDSAFP